MKCQKLNADAKMCKFKKNSRTKKKIVLFYLLSKSIRKYNPMTILYGNAVTESHIHPSFRNC